MNERERPSPTPKARVLIESITPIEWNGFKIRCWREEQNYSIPQSLKTHELIASTLEKLESDGKKIPARLELAVILLSLLYMNAVEVTDTTGHGCVLYKDWP